MEISGVSGKVYKITDWIMALATANFLWFVFNLPIVYLVFIMLLTERLLEWLALGAFVVILAPFVLFPATTAMFGVIKKRVIDEDIKLIRTFFIHYKENYVRSMLGGLIICLVLVILAVDYYFFMENVSKLFAYFFFIIAFFLLVFTLHFFSVTVHMYTSLFGAMKNACLITLGNPLLTLGIGLFSGFIIYCSFQIMTFLIPFFMGSLIALASYFGFFKFFLKVQAFK
ncbi:DUF624 domain-containing protein [Gracilibacillus sp. YIM 98692]|uniref:YesL family protein n=1 Tax=Gracilibacillus sp. YIM 98692 TaxID=2663532 RepID=UPI0013D3F28A|nr:DUF624 domain-containing protein [Gracilibacillus sp. YIM 98692]